MSKEQSEFELWISELRDEVPHAEPREMRPGRAEDLLLSEILQRISLEEEIAAFIGRATDDGCPTEEIEQLKKRIEHHRDRVVAEAVMERFAREHRMNFFWEAA